MPLYRRAQFRDRIRRKIGIIPPIDISLLGAIEGQQPTNYPYPTNMQINDALIDAIADVNRMCKYHVETYNVPVAAADSDTFGPFVLDLEDFQPNTSMTALFSPEGHINDILRVLWTPDTPVNTPPILVAGANRNSLDRGMYSNYYANEPAIPQNWFVEQYKLYLTPAQSVSGTYNLTCGTGLVGLICDDDVLDQCPEQWQNTFESQAIKRLAMMDTQNVESQERYQYYTQMATEGMRDWMVWREGNSGTAPASFAYTGNYRRGYGTRRTVR